MCILKGMVKFCLSVVVGWVSLVCNERFVDELVGYRDERYNF